MKGFFVVASCALATALAQVKTQQAVNLDASIVQDFEQRISEYQKLHKTLEATLSRLKRTPSPEKIEHHQHELAHKIREARRMARQGDIFTPSISAEFRRLALLAMQGQNAVRVDKSLKSAEPVRFRLVVNRAYPSNVPLQSMPPTLLMNLPKLPPEVDYRLVGHDLILLDVKANLVVDFIPNAIL